MNPKLGYKDIYIQHVCWLQSLLQYIDPHITCDMQLVFHRFTFSFLKLK